MPTIRCRTCDGFALALSRNLYAWRESLLAGRWQQSTQFCLFDHPIRDLHGATLGIVGSGSLGAGVIKLAKAFGMRILLAERKGATTLRQGYTAFETMLARIRCGKFALPADG